MEEESPVKIPLICAALALTGCASVDQLRQQAPFQSELTLCEKAILGQGPIVMVAREELNRRGANCNQHMAAIAAVQANNAQQTQLGLQLLQAAQPRPVVTPPPSSQLPVNCSSRAVGNTVQTSCF